jgi:ankyrin repeat protein
MPGAIPSVKRKWRHGRVWSDKTWVELFFVDCSEMEFSLNLRGARIKWIERSGRIQSVERVEAHLFAVKLFEPSFSPNCGPRVFQRKEVAMSTQPERASYSLPAHPNLRHLKDQAKDLLKAGTAESIADAQFKIARQYGFASWPKLKSHVESLEQIGQLKNAIDANDLPRVKALMTQDPALHRAPIGYRQNGPLTWAAECRGAASPPTPDRLAIAQWMLDNGSDIHQGGDGPLMRASLKGDRIPMMELLVSRGANVNAKWDNRFPILFGPCETVEPTALQWLLDHGADPNCRAQRAGGTAFDYLLGAYARSIHFPACIEILLAAGGETRYNDPAVLALLRGRIDELAALIAADPALVHRRFPNLDIGATGARRLTLKGATLLHAAAEFGNVQIAALLVDRGADINARATIDDSGLGGQSPIFHAVTQFDDRRLSVAQWLIEKGADLSLRAKLPGHYERPDEVVECTPLGYALRFPGGLTPNKTVIMLSEHGALE